MRVAGDGQAGRGKAMEHVDHVAAGTFAICVISLCPEFDQEPGAAARPGDAPDQERQAVCLGRRCTNRPGTSEYL